MDKRQLNWADTASLAIILFGTIAAGTTAADQEAHWWLIIAAGIGGFIISLGLAMISSFLAYRALLLLVKREPSKKSNYVVEFIMIVIYMVMPMIFLFGGVECIRRLTTLSLKYL